jgi:hypothetical protein
VTTEAETKRTDEAGKYQNDLIHQRLAWLGTFESVLVGLNHFVASRWLIPAVGLALALSIWVGTYAANRALTDLKAQAFGDWRDYLMPGTAIPTIIGAAWIVVLSKNLFR